ncbi:MAG: 4-hydroxy-3-methylbut-2-enyl diphosphate reductase [Deltaproteobacteria bacterium]|nr:4-hydroxy-3-methylbut-2-enyl diphosphate reductase [Deltaproteobacteria bacterium]
MRIIPARTLGYCLGVKRAMNLAFGALKREKGPVYGAGPLIHNKAAFDLLERRGLLLHREGEDLEEGAVVIIRAHGLPPEKEAALRKTGALVIDATCPRVKAAQRLVRREAEEGGRVIIWGSPDHPEVEGLLGYCAGRGAVIRSPRELDSLPDHPRVLLVAQTTQDASEWGELKKRAAQRFQGAEFRAADTICEATTVRQREALELAGKVDMVAVVGGKNSGNTMRLYNLVKAAGKRVIAVEGPEDVPPSLGGEVRTLGLVAGASTPNWQIKTVEQALSASGRAGEHSPGSFVRRLFRALVLTNTYVSLGGAIFGWAAARALGFSLSGLFFGIYVYFALSNHLLHGFLDRDTTRFNDPDRAAFLYKYEKPLKFLGFVSLLGSLTGAWLAGNKCFICLLSFAVLSATFNLLFHFKFPERRGEPPRIRDFFFFSKTLHVAMGWSLLLTMPPLFSDPPPVPLNYGGFLSILVCCAAVILQLFSRNCLTDLLNSKGDRVFERENPVSYLGEEKAPRFLRRLFYVWAFFLLLSVLTGLLRPAALCFILGGPIYNGLMLSRLKSPGFLGGYRFDLLVDGQFFLTGLLVFIHSLIFN